MRSFFTILTATALLANWMLVFRCSAQDLDVADIKPEGCGLHICERFQTGFWCAGARDEAPRSTRVVLRELVTPYEARFWDTLTMMNGKHAYRWPSRI
jgi:hypothetical protein